MSYEPIPLPESGSIESLRTLVNTIKRYCIPVYPENENGQKEFIRIVLDEVVKEVEASICKQETDVELAKANENYIAAIPALCRGEAVPCAMHVSQPIVELRKKLETENLKLKQTVQNLIREGNAIIEAGDDESQSETACMDWGLTVDEAAELLATNSSLSHPSDAHGGRVAI